MKSGSGWTVVWAYNGTFMFLQSIVLASMAAGAFFWYPRLIGTICNFFCACIFHFIAVVLLFAGRFNPKGKLCALNIVPSTMIMGIYDGGLDIDNAFYGTTYKD